MIIHPVQFTTKLKRVLPSLTQTEEGLSREGDESEDGSEIYQAFGLHPEGSSEDAAAADDTYYTRRLYNNDGNDNGYKLYNNEERLYIVSENLGESAKVPVRSNSYLFQGGGDGRRKSRTTGNDERKNSNGTNGWKSVPPSRQNSVVPSALRREKAGKASVLPPLHKVSFQIHSHLSCSLAQAKAGQGGYREPACFPIFRWCLSLLGLAMLLVVVVILGQLLSDFDLDRVPVVEASANANFTLATLPSPASTALPPVN